MNCISYLNILQDRHDFFLKKDMFWCQQDIILKMSLFDELNKYSFHLWEFDVLPDIWRLQRGQSVCP